MRLGSLEQFSALMKDFAIRARRWLHKDGYCVMVLGEVSAKTKSIDIGRLVTNIAVKQIGGFKLDSVVTNKIPAIRRSRKGSKVETESIVTLQRM
jgi:hypothetical protein